MAGQGEACRECVLKARIAELKAILDRINDHACTMRDQVGTGPLVTDVRHGFDTILRMTREANR